MALGNKRTTLLVAMAALILQPSAASRVGGGLARAIADPGNGDGDGGIPQLPPQPRECRPWLARMMPCAGFLTNNSTVYAPDSHLLRRLRLHVHVGHGHLPVPRRGRRHRQASAGADESHAHGGALLGVWPRWTCRSTCRGLQPNGWSAADRPSESLTVDAIAISSVGRLAKQRQWISYDSEQ
uniref:Uncharacterized protein n=1 Tax=Zea mays TaxID=4577 RepID=B6T5F7_MAIZE|nr:hypothetical protein [Zea mays]|eukprot:NP_001143463.1 uncharacterized protein LOC100276131 precursor [Zea mays]